MKIYSSEELKLITDIFDFEEKNTLDNDLKSLISEIKEMFLENQKLLNELQQKENIIKEVREYIEDNVMVYAFNDKKFPHWDFNDDNINDILKILDKGE